LHLENILSKYRKNDQSNFNEQGVSVTPQVVSVTHEGVSVTPQGVSVGHLKNNIRPIHDKNVCMGVEEESRDAQVDNASADAALSSLAAGHEEKKLGTESADPFAEYTDEAIERMIKSPLAKNFLSNYLNHPRIIAIMDRSNEKDVKSCRTETHLNK
jgi:hypothetical protein